MSPAEREPGNTLARSEPAARFRRPPSTTAAVLAELRRRIAAGELRPGERIRAEQLGAELAVSRVPVREALKILEGEGQVVYEAHRGAAVAELSLVDLREIYRMRELLEPEAIGSAVPLLSGDDVAALEELTHDMDAAARASDLGAYGQANRAFHLDLINASRRPRLVRVITGLWDASDAYRAMYANDPAHRDQATRDHDAILSALRSRDAAGAIAAAAAHRDRGLAALTQLLG